MGMKTITFTRPNGTLISYERDDLQMALTDDRTIGVLAYTKPTGGRVLLARINLSCFERVDYE